MHRPCSASGQKIKFYVSKVFKDAQKQGTSALAWLAVPENQKNLLMELRLESKEAEDQSVSPMALAVPIINGISSGGQDAKGNNLLLISGQWLGTKTLKVWREYTVEGGAIKQQTMKLVKPSEADAALGYQDYKGKPAYMNYETGASKALIIIPSKLPKGTLNNVIVIDNGVGMAAGSAPAN